MVSSPPFLILFASYLWLVGKTEGWSPVQIIVPIIVGVGMLATALICFFLYRWKSRKKGTWAAAIKHFLAPRVYKVRKADRDSARSLGPGCRKECEDDGMAEGDPESSCSKNSHLQPPDSIGVSGFSDQPQSSLQLPFRIGKQLRGLPERFLFPWKARAIEVKNRSSRRGFRIDAYDVSEDEDDEMSLISPMDRSRREAQLDSSTESTKSYPESKSVSHPVQDSSI